jgi:polyisoprenoid-binding protein YceI
VQSRTSRRLAGLAAVGIVLLAVAGAALWYFVFRDTSAPAVNVDRAANSLGHRTTGTTGTAGATGSGDDLSGTWTVNTTLGSFSNFTDSFAGYRIKENLVGIGAKTTTGRTPKVSGSLTFAANSVTATEIQVNLATLVSDDSQRDAQLRTQAIQTARFPTATFSLTDPIRLATIPADGATVDIDAAGKLTLHGVTRTATIPLQAKRAGDVIVVTGSLDVQFADYGITPPSSFHVVSVEDHAVMEFQLFFTRA